MVPASLLLLFAVRGVAGFVADLALARITQDGLLALRRDMFARLLDARLALFHEQNATALSNTVVFEVQNGSTLLVNAATGLIKDSVSLVALLAYLLYLNWQLTAIVFLIAPGVVLVDPHRVAPALSHCPQHPDRHQRPGLRGRGERAGRARGAPARRPGGAGRALLAAERHAAAPGDEDGGGVGPDHAADPHAGGGRAVDGHRHRAVAKPRRHHRGDIRRFHHGDADADRADQAAVGSGRPDFARTGRDPARPRPDRAHPGGVRRRLCARAGPGPHRPGRRDGELPRRRAARARRRDAHDRPRPDRGPGRAVRLRQDHAGQPVAALRAAHRRPRLAGRP